jgi:hypothetical protein
VVSYVLVGTGEKGKALQITWAHVEGGPTAIVL